METDTGLLAAPFVIETIVRVLWADANTSHGDCRQVEHWEAMDQREREALEDLARKIVRAIAGISDRPLTQAEMGHALTIAAQDN